MITLRNMASAFLANGDKTLMMKRSLSMKLAPGLWAPVGGHLEAKEISDPYSACLREIFEETGLSGEDIEDLVLRYIILRRSVAEIRIQYIYFGRSMKQETTGSDEGELHWIDKADLLNLETAATTRFILEHYYKTAIHDDLVYTGTVNDNSGKPVIQWAELQDWEEQK
jgi:8-oxo-dGTP diphosphatase